MRAAQAWLDLPMAAIWLVLAGSLAVATTRVVDWFVMTDEMLYERLALSIAQSGSPFPRVHGVLISNVNQLYPLLLGPIFAHGLVPGALRDAHALNAFVMSSACIPAYLLTRRLTGRARLSYLVAVLTVCVPWIVLSSLLLTEVVAYPAFLWAVLALHNAVVSRGPRADAFALVGIAVAVLARTQFAIFLLVLPVALVVHALAYAEAPRRALKVRVLRATRDLFAAHRVLVAAYAVIVVAAVALAAAGRLSNVLGTYSVAAKGNVVPSGTGRSLLDHVGAVGLGTGIVPFLLGGAWLLAMAVRAPTRDRHAFAWVAMVSIVAVLLEVTSFDLRFGGGTVHDRYLFYVVPLVLVAFAAALSEPAWPRLSIVFPSLLLAVSFYRLPLPRFQKLNVDTPLSAIDNALLRFAGSPRGAQLLLAIGTVVLAVLFVQATSLLRRSRLVALLVVLTAVALPAETGSAFVRLFSTNGTSGRPITLAQSSFFAWIDKRVGRDGDVTMVPFPLLIQDYWANVGYWWDVEFWNASVRHDAVEPGGYSWTPSTFPKTTLTFDPATGRASASPSEYVAQAVADTRFHIAGKPVGTDFRGVLVTKAEQPWRAEWVTSGLFEDGWTRPGTVARIKVFADPGQTTPLKRYLTLAVRAPGDIEGSTIDVRSNVDRWYDDALAEQTTHQISVCVPPRGFAEVTLSSPASSLIYGDPTTPDSYSKAARHGGVLVNQIALADETGSC